MVVLALLNIIAALYILYLAAQHVANRRRVFWRGYTYTCVLYIYTFQYIISREISGIVIMSILYILAVMDLKSSREDSGA